MTRRVIDAVYQDGVFRPVSSPGGSVAEGQRVRLVLETDPANPPQDVLALAAGVYQGLSDHLTDEIERIALSRGEFFSRRTEG